MEKINSDANEMTLSTYITSYFYFIYNFLQSNDDNFNETYCVDIFFQMSKQFQTYFEIDETTWREMFTCTQFSDAFKFITDNNLFSVYSFRKNNIPSISGITTFFVT